MKKLYRLAVIYLALGLAMGVFEREATKFFGLHSPSSLALVHTHLLSLGFAGTLLLLLFHRLWPGDDLWQNRAHFLYHLGVMGLGISLTLRGLVEAREISLSSGLDHALSGMAGLFHILIALGLVFYMLILRRKLEKADHWESEETERKKAT